MNANEIRRGDIYYADMGPVVGSEQGGIRPVLIIQNDIGNRHSPTVIIASITGKRNKRNLPTHVEIPGKTFGLDRDSIILTEQVKTLDKKRLRDFRCHLNEEIMKTVDRAIEISFAVGRKTNDKEAGIVNELIKTNQDSERITVSGRSLHEFLEVGTPYHIWFPRMIEYGFAENVDFTGFEQKCSELGGRPSTDHQLTIDMAKELAMIQRTEKGKQARQYFIQIEKAWNSPEAIMARAQQIAQRTIANLTANIQALQPKAEQYDRFISGENLQDMNTVAKALGWGRNRLLKELRSRKILMRDNRPYQQYMDRGYFEVKQNPIPMGEQIINKAQTFCTSKGVSWLATEMR